MVGDAGRGEGMPRWVKVTLIAAALLVLLVVALLLTGQHGPGRHGTFTGPGVGPGMGPDIGPGVLARWTRP